jgi:RNA polymerase sigma-70 factor, ECF subfamily
MANGTDTNEPSALAQGATAGSIAVGAHDLLPALMPALRSFVRRFMRDADEAGDVAQDAAVRALTARHVPTNSQAYRVWLYRIARNAAVDAHRRRAATLVPVEVERVDPWLIDHRLVTDLSVRQALMRISPDHRRVLLLVDVEELSYSEACRRLGVPTGTVMSRVARARTALLRAIEQDEAAR